MGEGIGKTCGVCGAAILEGEEEVICPACGKTNHLPCWWVHKGCGDPHCSEAPKKPQTKFDGKAENSEPQSADSNDAVACVSCGSKLKPGQKFCPKCGSSQGDEAQGKAGRHAAASVEPSASVGAVETPSIAVSESPAVAQPAVAQPAVAQPAVVQAVDVAAPAKKRCISCGAELNEGQGFCSKCGAAQTAEVGQRKLFCTKCGRELGTHEVFCGGCGQKVATNDNAPVEAIYRFNESVGKEKQKKSKGKLIGIVAGAVVVVIIVAVMAFGSGPDFKKIYADYCDSSWASVGSDGSYISIDTNPYNRDSYTNYDADDAISKVNKACGFGDDLREAMGQTSWSMGKQTQENNKVKVTWTYHPDKGLEVTYTKK